jgi:formyl-CoA transferase
MAALDGLRILDLTQYEAGTSCTQLLAWLGADVVKIEQAGVGDPGRHLERGMGDSLYFLSYNANKRSVALNLKSAAGHRIFLDLIPHFDAVVENFSLGTMEDLGLGYDVLKEANPRVIYATIKGFGTYGPYSSYRCYDMVAQAAGGAISITGYPDRPPVRPGPSMGDTASGMSLALGILAAYVEAQRTGRGQKVEVAMQEAVLNVMRTALSHRELQDADKPIPRRGNRTTSPIDLYPCAPGGPNDYVYIMPSTPRMFQTLMAAIGRPELASDERFATMKARGQNGDELFEIVADWTRQRTKYEAMESLGGTGVPCGAVLDTLDIFEDKHLEARDTIVEVDHPTRGKWKFIAPPFRLSNSHVDLKPAPLLGQHTTEVLQQELGLDQATVASLADEKAIGVLEPAGGPLTRSAP